MKKLLALIICYVCVILVSVSYAENRTISWDPVTTYTDNTPIEVTKTVSYISYWSTSSSLTALHTIGALSIATSAIFDPTVQGMIRGTTVYFTAKAVLNTGEESALSPAYSWLVPVIPPPTVPGKAKLDSVDLTK